VPVAASSDAPYASPDPWTGVAAAVRRRTRAGRAIGPAERVDPATALELYLAAPEAPGERPRRVTVGAPGDLCLLDAPLAEVLREPSAAHVRLTLVNGAPVHHV
jgi:predicted amidohydrolase YtcJ